MNYTANIREIQQQAIDALEEITADYIRLLKEIIRDCNTSYEDLWQEYETCLIQESVEALDDKAFNAYIQGETPITLSHAKIENLYDCVDAVQKSKDEIIMYIKNRILPVINHALVQTH
jgi:hypothetical protein